MITTIVQLHNELEFLPFWFSCAVKHSDEIVCGINNCADGSDAWIENYSKNSSIPIKIIHFNENTILNNKGFSHIKNELIEASSGKWIVSLDVDEEMDITKEEIQKIKNKIDLLDNIGYKYIDSEFNNHYSNIKQTVCPI